MAYLARQLLMVRVVEDGPDRHAEARLVLIAMVVMRRTLFQAHDAVRLIGKPLENLYDVRGIPSFWSAALMSSQQHQHGPGWTKRLYPSPRNSVFNSSYLLSSTTLSDNHWISDFNRKMVPIDIIPKKRHQMKFLLNCIRHSVYARATNG